MDYQLSTSTLRGKQVERDCLMVVRIIYYKIGLSSRRLSYGLSTINPNPTPNKEKQVERDYEEVRIIFKEIILWIIRYQPQP